MLKKLCYVLALLGMWAIYFSVMHSGIRLIEAIITKHGFINGTLIIAVVIALVVPGANNEIRGKRSRSEW